MRVGRQPDDDIVHKSRHFCGKHIGQTFPRLLTKPVPRPTVVRTSLGSTGAGVRGRNLLSRHFDVNALGRTNRVSKHWLSKRSELDHKRDRKSENPQPVYKETRHRSSANKTKHAGSVGQSYRQTWPGIGSGCMFAVRRIAEFKPEL